MRPWLALSMLALTACSTRGACVSTYPGASAGPFDACRDDLDRAACTAETPTSAFTPGRTCIDVGFPCFHDAWGAVLFERMASGHCPPRTTDIR